MTRELGIWWEWTHFTINYSLRQCKNDYPFLSFYRNQEVMPFIAFEGLDGSGKSTLMKELCLELDARNIKYHLTREPGGTPLGDELRKLIVTTANTAPLPRAELLLYEASRAQLVEEIIKPNLKKGVWVVSDRFAASSIAFQSGGRKIETEDVNWLNKFATEDLHPDLYVLLDLPVDIARKRQLVREQTFGSAPDRIESEKNEFHERVRQSFLRQATLDSKRWVIIDAEMSTQQMSQLLIQELKKRGWIS